jgi:hypothetical protein
MDETGIELAKTPHFISLWFQWSENYTTELSNRDHRGYGYRCGAFFPDGARNGQHHPGWLDFYKSRASNGFPYIRIHALFCYQNYPSCQRYIESDGRIFTFP